MKTIITFILAVTMFGSIGFSQVAGTQFTNEITTDNRSNKMYVQLNINQNTKTQYEINAVLVDKFRAELITLKAGLSGLESDLRNNMIVRKGFIFLGNFFPEMPKEELPVDNIIITRKKDGNIYKDGSFMFLGEVFPAAPAEELKKENTFNFLGTELPVIPAEEVPGF